MSQPEGHAAAAPAWGTATEPSASDGLVGADPRPVELSVEVAADAAGCLDLVLDHVQVAYRDLVLGPRGAMAIVEVGGPGVAEQVAGALRQHLGPQLLRCEQVPRPLAPRPPGRPSP